MAEAEAPEIILINAMWAALESYQPFLLAVKPGNRLKETLKRGQGVRYALDSKPSKQASDLSELDIDIGQFSMANMMRTFCADNRIEEHRQVFIFTITVNDTGVTKAAQVKRTILNALRNSTRNLGIPTATLNVVDWEIPTGGSNRPNKPGAVDPQDTGDEIRRQLTMNIAVRYRLRI